MKKLLLSLLFIAITQIIEAQTYVNINATGANNGTSWTDAYTDLHSATFNTTSGEIWVAQGTYIPSRTFTGTIPGNNSQKTFRIQYNVQVYGGFIGTETLLTQRNWKTNATILSGNQGSGVKSYNVVRFDANNNTTVLDGFTIQDGLANGTTEVLGGGIYSVNASPAIRNCKVINSTASQFGGGVYLTGGTSKIISCEFKNNATTLYDGAALYMTGQTGTEVVNSLFHGNYSARHGGALLVINSTTVQITNNTFVNNAISGGGSGQAIQASTSVGSSTVFVDNCIFHNAGSAAYEAGYNGATTLNIQNCYAPNGTADMLGTSVTGMVSGTPHFTDYNNGDYTLQCKSPAVNSGNATGLTIPSIDLNGDPRTYGVIDMGCYENNITAIGIEANRVSICSGDFIILRGTCDPTGYTWSHGVTNGVAFYPTTTQTYTCTGVFSSTTAQILIEVLAVNNEVLTAPSSVCPGTSATITTASSVAGVDYFLRNNATDYIVHGPVAGTGSSISFTTLPITATTTYNVIGATNPVVVVGSSTGLDFDGSNDKVNTTFVLPAVTEFTIEARLFPRATSYNRIVSNYSAVAAGHIIFDTYNAVNNGMGLRLAMHGSGGVLHSLSVANVLTLNAWNHVAVTFNNGVVKLFVNGVQVATNTASYTSLPVGPNGFCFGEDALIGVAEYLNGRLDEVRFWNKARTALELTAKMNTCLAGTESNLLAYYNFDDGTGSSIVTDNTAGTNNGTLSSMDPATDWISSPVSCNSSLQDPSTLPGKALDFDGTNDIVETQFIMPTTSAFSIQAWIYPRATFYKRIVSNFDGVGSAGSGEIVLDTYNATDNGRALRLTVQTGVISTANVLTLNAWNHVSATFDNGLMTIYVNGFDVGNITVGFTSVSTIGKKFILGEDNVIGGSTEYFNGKMDEVRFWNKALTQTEILANMNSCLLGTETNLSAYFNCEDGTGELVSDITANQNHAQMLNMDPSTDWVDGKFTCNSNCDYEMTQLVTINVASAIDTSTTVLGLVISSDQTGASYQWIDCNNANQPISGETGQSFSVTANGNYAVIVTVGACSDTSACLNFSVVGIPENISLSYSLSPNPAAEFIIVQMAHSFTSATIEVMNTIGQVVSNQKINSATTTVSLPGASGLYFIKVTADGISKTTKVIRE